MYIDDFAFVLSEVARLARLDTREIMKPSFREILAMLPHPSGSGGLMCSIEAYERLRNTAELGLSKSAHAGTIEVDVVFNALKEVVVQRFLHEKRELTTRAADLAVAAAIRVSAKAKQTLTHFVPCHLGHAKTPESFSIGPVRFEQRKRAMKCLEPMLQLYIETDDIGDLRVLKERLTNETRDYYESFGWIGEVTILDCDTATSRRQADLITQGALDCLHLLIGAAYSNHMRAGGPNFSTDRRGRIELTQTGLVEITTSVDSLSHNLGDSWWDRINGEGGDYLLELMGVALSTGYAIPKPAPLSQRFLDGVAWYGEAVRDSFAASRIVKYVTAIERMLTTKNEEKLSESLAFRGAALIHEPGTADIEPTRQRFRDVYDLRSRLVHGSRSPLDRGFGPGLKEAEELARLVLMRGLQFFRREGLEDPDISLKHLDQSFSRLLTWADATGPGLVDPTV